ncbi:uncharacterized protein LOC131649298 [Vicia villosa]|uniref:uncharacterized protein LOC131649298 n=1 Tax=Vicia villosa TaxID=3911 RepID=UPI00273BEBED|nr:uncharacterized protein LOC131649298 [Vicia villosa]
MTVSSSSHYIHYGVYDLMGGFKYWLTAIYAKNQVEQRRILWTNMNDLCRKYLGRWCVVGDFNNVANSLDRVGEMVVKAEYEDFNNMMSTIGLCEMDSKGEYFTWSNKQNDNPIYSRIDRLISNTAWFQVNDDATLNVLPPNIYDHSMLHLSKPDSQRNKWNTFKSNNSWVDLDGFQNTVNESWNKPMYGRPMEVLWKKLHRLQPVLRKLNEPVSDIQQQITKA